MVLQVDGANLGAVARLRESRDGCSIAVVDRATMSVLGIMTVEVLLLGD